ncbi:MAG: bifunctional folylpolyglutamate synthase/dihydrofolate synthase [Alphaproteobacteria bacterium]|nr:bifunctional folylpolyglutamate synthase/dihydrofolate synthase [Alphaproteobacteria bacterium]
MFGADATHPDQSLQDKLLSIYALRSGTVGKIDLTLRPEYLMLLARLGDPHLRLPPVIHVAGTNGKGSVLALLQAMFAAGRHQVHAYRSPHLKKFNERIVLSGKEISDARLESLLDRVLESNDGAPLTFFEITTALAFLAFTETPADLLLLEVGLGGRLDSTNVVEDPLATVITKISRDHTEFLGETLPAIAAEKAGIMKPGAPCIIGPQEDESVWPVFEERAAKISCPLYRFGREWNVEEADSGHLWFRFRTDETLWPRPALTGRHQIDNAGTALALCSVLAQKKKHGLSAAALRKGLTEVCHPGRLQRLTTGPLASMLPTGWELWVDGGHNDSAGAALAAQARLWSTEDPKPLHLICGMMRHKNPRPFLQPLLPHLSSLTLTGIPGVEESCPPALLLERIAVLPFAAIKKAQTPQEALSSLIKSRKITESRVLIAGSLYLAGYVL